MKRLVLGFLLAIPLASLAVAASQPLTVPFFKQQKDGCGAASVAMVMHYWGGQRVEALPYPAPAQVYQALYDKELGGIPLVEMKHYLENNGFRAYTLHGQFADVEQHVGKGRPVIVSLKKKDSSPRHFAVVTGTTKSHVLLNDPTHKGTTRMKRAEFDKQWNRAETWMLLAAPVD